MPWYWELAGVGSLLANDFGKQSEMMYFLEYMMAMIPPPGIHTLV